MPNTRGLYAGLAHRTSPLAFQQAVTNLAVHHISAVRMNKVRGITFVKHIGFGWMSVGDYYRLQKLHDAMPVVIEVIKGGYILKAAIWNVTLSADFLASGLSVPMGVLVLFGAFTVAVADGLTPGSEGWVALDLLAPVLPFGEIYLLWRLGADIWTWWKHVSQDPVLFPLLGLLTGPLGYIILLWLSGGGPPSQVPPAITGSKKWVSPAAHGP